VAALRDARGRIGIRRAVAERVRANLELDSGAADREDLASAVRSLTQRLEATRAELAAAAAQSEQGLGEVWKALSAYALQADTVAERLDLHAPLAPMLAGPAALERIIALEHWLRAQPPSEMMVSVVIPTHKRPALVREAIASVQAQTHQRWEAIVVDDNTDPGTERAVVTIDDDRVRYVRIDDVGPAHKRNCGIEHARGDAIVYLDDDNLMSPHWLEGVAWAFSTFPEVDFLYGARVIESDPGVQGGWPLPRVLFSEFSQEGLARGDIADTNVMAHRSGLPQARWSAEFEEVTDWELAIRLTEHKPALALPVIACLYRTHAPDRISRSADFAAHIDRLREHLGGADDRYNR
jgi:hypothetical protein